MVFLSAGTYWISTVVSIKAVWSLFRCSLDQTSVLNSTKNTPCLPLHLLAEVFLIVV